MVNFYHRFIPSAAQFMQSLYTALVGSIKKSPIQWNPTLENAFQTTKTSLAKATITSLTHPVISAPTALTTDASDVALGGVLEQQIDADWRPLAFFSRQLRPPVKKHFG